jgi:cyclopropane-fatty-acyl-phospholipid synthase
MNVISQIFKDKKSLPLNIFIDKALYNKKYGYYSKKNPIGTRGDFITAPLISELFGEMVAIWCIAFWEKLRKPKNINIVELGPGEGSLCMTLIKVFSRFKIFNDAFEIKLLERSKFLRKIQEKKITSKKVKWIKSIEEVKNGPTIFIANEFFDALPIKQFVSKKGIWHERFVKCINDKKLIFYDKKTNLNNIKHFALLSLAKKQKFIEFPIEEIKYLK